MVDRLYLNLAHAAVGRALRQERRTQQAAGRLIRHQEKLGSISGVAPASWVRRERQLDDEMYFLILTVAQAVKARDLLVKKGGFDLPDVEAGSSLTVWRNVLEHWDDPPRGKPLRALSEWREQHLTESEPGLTRTFVGDRLTSVSGISLKRLRNQLKRLEKAIGAVAEEAWDREWITVEEAAELLAVPVEDVPLGLSLDFSDLALGRRYNRELVEARRDGTGVLDRWQ